MKTKLRHLTLTHCIIVAFLSLLFAPAADAAWWREYQKMAMYISAETVEAIESPQERAAAQLFKKEFWLDGQFITPSQLNRINAENFDCIWIHIDSNGLGSSAANYNGYNSPEFISAIRKFHQDGGNLYLSKFAVQLLFSDGIGRLDDKFRPNIFSDGEGKSEGNIWCINAEIGARALSPGWDTPTQYHDRRNHIIYSGLTTMKSTEWTIDKDPIYDRYVYDVFPMQGASDKSSTQRYDHNCMWRLSGKTTEGLKVGMYIGDNDKFNIDGIAYPQEKAAIKFTQTFNVDQEVEIITKDDLVRIDPNNFDCLWIHIDRPGLSQGWTNLPEAFRNDEFITKLRSYVKEGGNLYLTKYATQLVVPVERIPERYAPNIFDTGSGNTGDTPWYIQAQINYFWKDSDPDIFHDRTHHDIYIGMTMQEYQANDESRYNAFPAIQGDVENHNCLWDLNRFYTGGNKVEQFREENLVRILGTWGHVVDDAVAGIIEFRPPQIQGRIIANGWAHCYSLPREWSLDHNRQLCQKPADEVRWIRSRQTFSQKNFTLSGDRYIGSGRHMEFKAVAKCGSAPWGIRFLKNPANPDHSHASLTVNPADGSITLSLQHMPRIVNDGIYNGLYTASFPELIAPGKEVTVDLFIDSSVADIFLNERHAASVRIYPHDENGVQAELFSTGGDTGFIAADAWPINTRHNRSATAHTIPLTEQSRRMAILVENADPEALSPSERAALRLFEAACPNRAVLTPGDIGNLSFNNYGTLWIHLDRCGIDRNNPPLSSSEITDALSSFMAQGGSLYLSGHATLLLAKTGRIDSALAPNIFNDGDGGSGTDVWNIQPRIGYFNRESDPSQYYDRSGHTIFADMYTIDTPQGRTIPMEGTGDGSEMWREDHNCMWDLNNLSYTADGRNTVERFERQTNSTVLGQWGHVTDYAVAGLVEFHPQASASRAMPAQGTVIANGLAAYELSPRLGGNSYTANVERLTGNILRYLESKDTRGSMTFVETPETDTTPPTPVFTSSPGAITYRGVTPGETIYVYTPDGRLAANSTAIYPDGSIILPLRGTAIVRCGSHAAKILIK